MLVSRLFVLIGCLLSSSPVDSFDRAVIPNGVLITKTADAWVLSDRWTVITTISRPPEVPVLSWIQDLALRITTAHRSRVLSSRHLESLASRLDRIRPLYTPSPSTFGPQERPRRPRGLINFVGQIGSALFGVATEGQVHAVHQEILQAEREETVLYHNQQKLVSILNSTRAQTISNYNDIMSLAGNISRELDRSSQLAWKLQQLHIFHDYLSLVNQLEQLSYLVQLRRRSYLAACEAMRSGHLSPDVVSDFHLQQVLAMLSRRGYVMSSDWYRAYTPVKTVWDNPDSLTCVFTLWAAHRDVHRLWTLKSLWFRKGVFVARYLVRSPVLTDKAFSYQHLPAECRGTTQAICFVPQSTHEECELSLVQGRAVQCKFHLARVAPPLLEYLATNHWLVGVTTCTNITVRCPDDPAIDVMVCKPERWNVSTDCVIEWPLGRTVSTDHHFLNLAPRYYAPLKWVDLDIPEVKREKYVDMLSVHAHLLINPDEDLSLEPLPTFVPLYHSSTFWSPSIVLLLALLTLVISLVCCCKYKWCCFAPKRQGARVLTLPPALPLRDLGTVPTPQDTVDPRPALPLSVLP